MNFDISVTRKTMCPGEDVKIGAVVVGKPKIKGYRWNFGDGTSDTGKNVVHQTRHNSGLAGRDSSAKSLVGDGQLVV